MSNVKETLVPRSATIKQVIETIEQSQAKVALMIDDAGRLVGTVTDGDVRRGLLRGEAVRPALKSLLAAVANDEE